MAPRIFSDIRFFVLCQGLMQIGQLILGSYLRSVITQIERRFQLSSEVLGRISTGFQIGSFLVILPVSYIGSFVHRPRGVAITSLIMATGALISVLPHLILDKYELGDSAPDSSSSISSSSISSSSFSSSSSSLCFANFTSSCDSEKTSQNQSKMQNMWILFFFSQLVIGIGAAALQPFGISYIDDNSEKKDSALYVAILFAISLIGPAFGFMIGSITTNIYVDIGREGADEIDIKSGDPRWVGAWWMGFMIASLWLVTASIPFWLFPRKMTKSSGVVGDQLLLKNNNNNNYLQVEQSEKSKIEMLQEEKDEEPSLKQLVKDFPKITWGLLTNLVVLALALQALFHMAVIAGVATFMAKYLQNQFSISASKANLFVGTIGVPCVCIGILVGGVLMKKLNFSSLQAIRFCICVKLTAILITSAMYFIGCPTPPSAGVNQPYLPGETIHPFQSSCNSNCGCSKEKFIPICGADGVRYFSPCFAGCQGNKEIDFAGKNGENKTIKIYTECSCISQRSSFVRNGGADSISADASATSGDISGATPGAASLVDGEAMEGVCLPDASCAQSLVVFGVVTFITGLIEAMASSPIYIVFIRSVDPKAKSYSIGLINLVVRTIGFMPSPIYHGMLIDSTCLQWGEKCGVRGACKIYDNQKFRVGYYSLHQGLAICGMLAQCLAWYAITRRPDGGHDKEETEPERKKSANLETMAEVMRASTMTLDRTVVEQS